MPAGLSKHGKIIGMLTDKYALGYGNANLLVHEAEHSSAMATDNPDDLIAEQYKRKEMLGLKF